MADITALGELLVDFTQAGFSPAGYPLFEQNPGGAPANLLAAAAKQDTPSSSYHGWLYAREINK